MDCTSDMFPIQSTGLKGRSRDDLLVAELRAIGMPIMSELGVLVGSLGEPTDFDIAILGRPRRESEVGCREAHSEALARIATSQKKWGIVLEDDARLLRHDVACVLDRFFKDISHPAIVLLGRPSHLKGSLLGKIGQGVKRILIPPDYSFAYAANELAAELSLHRNSGHGSSGMSDWPPELLSKARFYRLEPIAFTTDSHQTTTILRDKVPGKFSVQARIEAIVRMLRRDPSFAVWGVLKILIARNLILLMRNLGR